MALVVIDAGNTQVKLVQWAEEVPLPNFQNQNFSPDQTTESPVILGSVPTKLLADPSLFSAEILDLVPDDTNGAVLVSVIPEISKILLADLPDLVVVARNGSFPFPHELKEAHTVGPDRFCNVAAAMASGLQSALIVDAGTATTFDLLWDGIFEGGLIAPGMAFAARQLALHGAMLEEFPFMKCPAVVGQNTEEAMTAGAWLTGSGGVEWTISRLLETYGDMPVIVTGGLSQHLDNPQRYCDPFWTLRGAAVLAGKTHPFPGHEAR